MCQKLYQSIITTLDPNIGLPKKLPEAATMQQYPLEKNSTIYSVLDSG